MHVGLNKVLSIEDQAPVPEPLTDSVQLKHFAREAEVNGRMELAARFYQEVFVYNVFCNTLFAAWRTRPRIAMGSTAGRSHTKKIKLLLFRNIK
jgi:hypothetical protein